MKRFRFTLQALLTLRQREEHVAMEAYAASLQRVRAEKVRLRSAEDELSQAGEALRRYLAQGAPAAEHAQRQTQYRLLDARRLGAVHAVRQAEMASGQALDGMLHARRQREIVEDCEVKQHQRYQREVAQAETKWLDELASRRVAPGVVWRGDS